MGTSIAPSKHHERLDQPVEGGKSIIDVGFRECRFPIGERDNQAMFCAEKTPVGETYCEQHHKAMYQPHRTGSGQTFVLPK